MALTPRRIAVRLSDLRIGEQFETALGHQHGTVVTTGHVRWVDRAGRKTRLRAVRVRYASGERIHSAELRVLVPSDRPHARWTEDESRWVDYLAEPEDLATVGEVACRWDPQETQRRLLQQWRVR